MTNSCITDGSNDVCVSAPGKVLVTGGYLVLDPLYSGLVLASTARIYAHVSATAAADIDNDKHTSSSTNSSSDASCADTLRVVVESPQFHQTIRGSFHRSASSSDAYQFTIDTDADRNAYIEETLLCAINGIEGLEPGSVARTSRKLQTANQRLHIELRADNDFYSQVQRLQATHEPLERRSLATLERFLPPFMAPTATGESVAMKTGMGSSAALVTSLVSALVCYLLPSNAFETHAHDRDVIHNLAQLAHCFVQRKIGSGFDVSAACFGSQRYTRFPPALLDAFTTPNALLPRALGTCLRDATHWQNAHRVTPFVLPRGLRLFMGDVSAGSATVSMVRHVLQWQQAAPEAARRIVTHLAAANAAVNAAFDALDALIATCDDAALVAMASATSDQWVSIDAALGAGLQQLRDAFVRVRTLLREMGDSANVPIEPPAQAALVDATMAVPGVVMAGVPGAGGFDAVFVIALDDARVLDRVEQLWVAWPQMHPTSLICPLLSDVDPFAGICREQWQDVVGTQDSK